MPYIKKPGRKIVKIAVDDLSIYHLFLDLLKSDGLSIKEFFYQSMISYLKKKKRLT
jgi:hypothetical protein